MQPLLALTAGIAPGLLWLLWIRRQDSERPEPPRLVLRVFALGALSTLLVLALRPGLEDLLPLEDSLRRDLLDAFLVTAPLEEFAKLAALLVGVLWHREFDEPLDGVVYGAAAALGFASVENGLYVLETGSAEVAVVRSFTAMLAHVSATATLGFFVGLARLGRGRSRRAALVAIGITIAVTMHGLYDLFLIADAGLAWVSLLCVLPLMLLGLRAKIRWSRARSV